MDLTPLWYILEREKGDINLHDAIKKAGLPLKEAKDAVKEELALFTKKWKWLGFKNKKGIKKLADTDLFYHVILLRKCRNTPPENPSMGGLLKWYDLLEGIRYSTLGHPNYKDLLEARTNG